jgi:hypothetical protein
LPILSLEIRDEREHLQKMVREGVDRDICKSQRIPSKFREPTMITQRPAPFSLKPEHVLGKRPQAEAREDRRAGPAAPQERDRD